MSYFHPEEEHQVWALEAYDTLHSGTRYLVEFPDGEAYICTLDTAYDSDNGGELDIEDDNPLYDEFHQASMQIIEVKSRGLRSYGEWLNLDYRDWPARISDTDRGAVVYPVPTT